jgi:hypothetical protein
MAGLLTPFGIATVALLLFTILMAVFRYTNRLDSNWPLVFYLLLVLHTKIFEGGLNPYVTYVAIVTALFIRFEFMGGIILKFFRLVELCCLAYFGWRLFGLLMLW